MRAHYHATLNPEKTTSQRETYNIWREQNPDARPNIDFNKLGTVRRGIVNKKRLTDSEINNIIKSVKDELKITHPHLFPEPETPANTDVPNTTYNIQDMPTSNETTNDTPENQTEQEVTNSALSDEILE